MASAYRLLNAASEDPDAFTLGSSRAHTAGTIAVRGKLVSEALSYPSSTAGFPIVVETATGVNSASNVSSHPISLPSSLVAGDLLLVVFSVDGNPTVSVNTGVSGSNWNKLGQSSNTDKVTGAIFWKIAEGGDALTLTTSANEKSSHISYRIRNAVSVSGTASNGSSTNSDPPLHTPPDGAWDYLWIATRSGDDVDVATVAPTSFSNLLTIAAGAGDGASTNSAVRTLNATSLDPGTFTSANEQWVCYTLAVRGSATATVQTGHTVTLTADASVQKLTVEGTGLVTTGSNKLVITDNTAGAVTFTGGGSVSGAVERPIAATGGSVGGIYRFTSVNSYVVPAANQPATTMSISSFPDTWPVPAANNTGAIKRYYVISPTPSNFMADELRLEYLDSENVNSVPELSLVLYRNNSVTLNWENKGGIPNSTFNYVTSGAGADINAWSSWAIGDGNAPLPVQLASFNGTVTINNRVRLDWRTAGEVNNYGFYVQKRFDGVTTWTEIPNSFVAGHGTTSVPRQYSYTDNEPLVTTTQYRLKQVDLDGSEHFSEPIVVDNPTSVPEVAPKQFALLQNYPNPFNPSTEIKFSVERNEPATLTLFNALGQKVATLFEGIAEAGQYYTVRLDGAGLASGIYMYRLQTGTKSAVRRLMLLK